MSAFVSVMPSPMSHFERGQDFFSSSQDSSNADYQDLASLPFKSYNEMGYPRSRGWSPGSSASSPSSGHAASFGRSSTAPSRSPPTRQRTPIRHHRSSVSRAHGGRSDALLAYATQQDSHATGSQSMASSQNAFPPSAYMMAPVSSSYVGQTPLYSSPGVSQQPHSGQYLMAPPAYSVEPNTSYMGLGRSASYSLESSPPMQSSESIFLPNLGSNTASQSWSSSISPPSLPSITAPCSTSYSSSTLSSLENPNGIRVLTSRPKPQCFDHGCNGRQFSTFSNLLRHQREKSGNASKHVCPYCGTEFTRTTARKGHVEGGKCKGRDGDGLGKEIRGPQAEEALGTLGEMQ